MVSCSHGSNKLTGFVVSGSRRVRFVEIGAVNQTFRCAKVR